MAMALLRCRLAEPGGLDVEHRRPRLKVASGVGTMEEGTGPRNTAFLLGDPR